MWIYLGIAVVCAAIVPWARRRSHGSMTTYSIRTGAPIVMVLFAVSALAAAWASAAGDPDLAREVFTGGLIGGALAQFILMRRTYGIRLEDHPAPAIAKARDAARARTAAGDDSDDDSLETPST